MVSEPWGSAWLFPMLGLQAHAAMSSILCGHWVLNSSSHDCKASNLTKRAISPAPKDNFFFKSLIWLKIKWGLDSELKYLWEKLLQRYPCLYVFTDSQFPLVGIIARTYFKACVPRSQYPRYHGGLYRNYRPREVTSHYSSGVGSQEGNFLLSFDCSVMWNSGLD